MNGLVTSTVSNSCATNRLVDLESDVAEERQVAIEGSLDAPSSPRSFHTAYAAHPNRYARNKRSAASEKMVND